MTTFYHFLPNLQQDIFLFFQISIVFLKLYGGLKMHLISKYKIAAF
jgi:hypothetical protein